MELDREKFKSLVHYIVWKAGGNDGFGATKLNKILWFSDAKAYLLSGKPITGDRYIRQEYGPVPHQIMPIRNELSNEGRLRIWSDEIYNGSVTRFKALVAPDSNILTQDEKQIVDYWIDHIVNNHTAESISEESHDYAWEIAKTGEELPMFAILANRLREPNKDELSKAKDRAKEIGFL